MSEIETEHQKKVRDYWLKAYDTLNANKDRLQYEPTAVLTSQADNDNKKKMTLRDILDLDLTR